MQIWRSFAWNVKFCFLEMLKIYIYIVNFSFADFGQSVLSVKYAILECDLPSLNIPYST